jgi:hypothetical protein
MTIFLVSNAPEKLFRSTALVLASCCKYENIRRSVQALGIAWRVASGVLYLKFAAGLPPLR